MDNPVLQAHHVAKSFPTPKGPLSVLSDICMTLSKGEAVGLMGPSGSGKTTLLHCLAGLESPDRGEISIEEQSIWPPSGSLDRLRATSLGFVFQSHYLLGEFTARENVAIPGMILGWPLRTSLDRAETLLELVGLGQRMDHCPNDLSGGEQQRVGIARALFASPRVILADEPTGDLDPVTGAKIFDLLLDLARKENSGLLVATHDGSVLGRCDRVWKLKEGRLIMIESAAIGGSF